MNTKSLSRRLWRLLAFPLIVPALDLSAPFAHAGPPIGDVGGMLSRASMFFAGLFTEVMADRTRLIQVSVLIVALGVALLWWRK